MRVAGRGYSDGVRNLEVMVESLSGGSSPEIQEEGRVLEHPGTTLLAAGHTKLTGSVTMRYLTSRKFQ